jgi:type IV pilus assembly protein PilA
MVERGGARCEPVRHLMSRLCYGALMNVNPGGAPEPQKKGMSALVIILIVGGVVFSCCIIGIVAAIAIPNFIKFSGRSKMAECKSVLRGIYQAEKTYFDEKKTYSTNFNELGFSPDARRYTYFISPETSKAPSLKEEQRPVPIDELPALAGGAVVGIEGECPECTFTAACAANLDSDPTLDVWSISTAPRGAVQAGEISHDVDDLK